MTVTVHRFRKGERDYWRFDGSASLAGQTIQVTEIIHVPDGSANDGPLLRLAHPDRRDRDLIVTASELVQVAQQHLWNDTWIASTIV